MDWRNDGFTLREYTLMLENSYYAAFGTGAEQKQHPEDLSLNLEIINNAVASALTNAWSKWKDK